MNKLTLKPNLYTYQNRKAHSIDIVIDGVNLVDIMRKIELPMATAEGYPKLAGGYGCAGVFMDTKKFFMGEEPFEIMASPKTAILVTGDTVEYDWPLLCHITIDGETVRWRSFQQPHRSEGTEIVPKYPGELWDYSDFRGFTFRKKQYFGEVDELLNVLKEFYKGYDREYYF